MSSSQAEGGIDAKLDFKNARQDVPSSGPDNTYPFGIGGFDTDRVDSNDMSNDDERPSPPNPDAKIGTDMNLASVAPIKTPWPKNTITVGLKKSDAAIIGG